MYAFYSRCIGTIIYIADKKTSSVTCNTWVVQGHLLSWNSRKYKMTKSYEGGKIALSATKVATCAVSEERSYISRNKGLNTLI